MSSLKFDLPQLDYTTRFSLWQVKMRAILTQSSDLDEALDGFGKKDAKTWTDDEKRKDPTLWLKLESICMSKDLTSKMHMKMKLFSHKLQEGASMMNHLSIFREIVSDLLSMEAEGSSSKAEALQVRGRTENRNNNYNRDKSKTDRGRSKSKGRDGKFCKHCQAPHHPIYSSAEWCDLTDAVDFYDNSDDEQQRISVQVEHVEEKENDVAENDNTVVQHSPPVLLLIDRGVTKVEHDTEPATYTEAVASVDRVKWISAMQEEMQSLDKNGTWAIVPLPKQKKVVRCIDYNDVFSPVVKHSFIRAFFGIVAMHDLELEQLDVKTAFLHGELEEEIYMDQPEGFVVPGKEDLVCKLKRSIYGLK
ncbi:hypothetical protein QYE76_005894 [Lolium multiflorum]|uniref:Reverse transcriptase Ty1/copia-type domain-containing protein n=1 Tax=Lolium multiflorum TaxID=4521 RepID=A0AAD8W2P8_LOLMU|nr:hypothetical protein QYE76_005894 [Lolium multiflorum]